MKPLSNQAASLARIEQKLDDVKETLQNHTEAFNQHTLDDQSEFKNIHDTIGALRRWQSWVVGISSGVVFILSLLGAKNLF
jgi:choline dehydrogenase-like flavoprotein